MRARLQGNVDRSDAPSVGREEGGGGVRVRVAGPVRIILSHAYAPRNTPRDATRDAPRDAPPDSRGKGKRKQVQTAVSGHIRPPAPTTASSTERAGAPPRHAPTTRPTDTLTDKRADDRDDEPSNKPAGTAQTAPTLDPDAHPHTQADGSERTCPDARADINVADRADAPPDSRADDRDDDPPDARPDAREISARRGRTYSCRTESRSEAGSCTTEALASSCTTEASAGTIAWAGGTVAANIRDRRRRPQTQPDPANFTQVKHTRWTENDSHHLVFHGEIFIPEGFLDKTRPVTFT